MNEPFELDAALAGSESDLDLLAFCYLTDELSPVAKEVFELRLATEQPLREALARAVELTAALKQARPVELNHAVLSPARSLPATAEPRAFDRWMRTTAILAVASAACLAVVIGVRALWQNQAALLPETAYAWSQVRDTWPESAATESLGSSDAGSSESYIVAEEGTEEVSSDMPGWLLTAVAEPGDGDATNEEALVPGPSTE